MTRRDLFKRLVGGAAAVVAAPAVLNALQPTATEYGLGFEITEALLADNEAFAKHALFLAHCGHYEITRDALRPYDMVLSFKARPR